MFKDIPGIGALFRQAQEFGSRARGLTEELRGQRVTGSAGGGMVEVEVNGLVEVLRCRIDSSLVSQGDRELLEDLIVGAVNQAIGKAKQIHAHTFQSMTGGIPVPGLEQALSKFFGAGPGVIEEEPGKPKEK